MEAHFQMSAREFAGCMQAVADEATGRAVASGAFFRWVGPAALIFVIGASLNWSDDRLLHGISWLAMLVSGLLIWSGFRRIQIGIMETMVTEGGLYTQPTTVEIGPENLVFSNRMVRIELLWTAIRRIDETEYHLSIYLDNLAVLFIPKRAFSSEAEFQAFFDKAKRWCRGISGPWAR